MTVRIIPIPHNGWVILKVREGYTATDPSGKTAADIFNSASAAKAYINAHPSGSPKISTPVPPAPVVATPPAIIAPPPTMPRPTIPRPVSRSVSQPTGPSFDMSAVRMPDEQSVSQHHAALVNTVNTTPVSSTSSVGLVAGGILLAAFLIHKVKS